MTTTYVLYIEFANHRPRVGVFDTADEAEAHLDAFEVSVFDPPQNDGLDRTLLRARIFECEGDSWGTEIDICAFRRKREEVAYTTTSDELADDAKEEPPL